nr:reverse transcriptase domain-containing protein [Tanacetum cinerariifolium]
MKKRDTGNPGTDTETRRTKICLIHGVAKRSTRLLGASVIFQKIREGACQLMSKLMMGQVKQRQGESTSAYVERYKDECIHLKACPEILKISGFMNGINNPELIKRLNGRVPQTFDELMKRTRSFIQGEAAAAASKKSYSNYKSQEQPRRQSNDQSSNHNNSYRNQRGDRGNDKYTPLTKTPNDILATEGANFPKPPPMRTPEERRVGNGYCEY